MIEREKRPSQYAWEIIHLPKADRAAALEAVPEKWRPWTEFYMRDWLQSGRYQAAIQATAMRLFALSLPERMTALVKMDARKRKRVEAIIDELLEAEEKAYASY